MIHIVGASHAPDIFRRAARHVGVPLCGMADAELIIIAEDCPTREDGTRDLTWISGLIYMTLRETKCPVIITCQVPPGFTRQYADTRVFCQAETLRIKDAFERAISPEQHIIGCLNPDAPLPIVIHRWLEKFPAPIHKMTYEEAEYSKIAINVSLAHQVQMTNTLFHKAGQYGCRWEVIKNVLQHDKRIGPHAYLEPGDWTKSPHLLRDFMTFNETRS